MLNFKKRFECGFIKLCTDDAKSANDICTAGAHVSFTRHMVKVKPIAVLPCYDAFGAQYSTITALIQCL